MKRLATCLAERMMGRSFRSTGMRRYPLCRGQVFMAFGCYRVAQRIPAGDELHYESRSTPARWALGSIFGSSGLACTVINYGSRHHLLKRREPKGPPCSHTWSSWRQAKLALIEEVVRHLPDLISFVRRDSEPVVDHQSRKLVAVDKEDLLALDPLYEVHSVLRESRGCDDDPLSSPGCSPCCRRSPG